LARRVDGASLLPFDAFYLPTSEAERAQVMRRQAARELVAASNELARVPPLPPLARLCTRKDAAPVVLYVSRDWISAHPTSIMVQGVLAHHNRTAPAMLSYGPLDAPGHPFRTALLDAVAPRWLQVPGVERASSAVARVRETIRPLVAIDLQGFTRGALPALLAARLAPVQAAYLVFPGPSASPWIDYTIADRVVAPPEARFPDRLALTPPSVSYQCSTYLPAVAGELDAALADPHAPARLRARFGLARFRVLFGQWNKPDKLTPRALHVWAQVLRATTALRSALLVMDPGAGVEPLDASRAALLPPPSALERAWDCDGAVHASPAACATQPTEVRPTEALLNLWREFEARGVHRSRIVALRRAQRPQHLARQRVVDLFLDSADSGSYGAHSTATDALRAAVPVLSMQGGVWTSRVAASLLRNWPIIADEAASRPPPHTLATLLLTHSARDYVLTAARLSANLPSALLPIHRFLLQSLQHASSTPLHLPTVTRALESLYLAMCTLRTLSDTATASAPAPPPAAPASWARMHLIAAAR
jgi:protein O-GlcNAc transferase